MFCIVSSIACAELYFILPTITIWYPTEKKPDQGLFTILRLIPTFNQKVFLLLCSKCNPTNLNKRRNARANKPIRSMGGQRAHDLCFPAEKYILLLVSRSIRTLSGRVRQSENEKEIYHERQPRSIYTGKNQGRP